MNKGGISALITTLLLILLGMVAIGVVWVVVSNLLNQGSQSAQFQFGTISLPLKIEGVTVNQTTGNISVVVSRGAGQANITGIAFVFSDGSNSTVVKENTSIQELGTQIFTFAPSNIGGVSFIKEIDIAPIVNSGNQPQIGSEADSTQSNYYNSCLGILKAKQSTGNGIYQIDTDGLGPMTPINVYCDMTTAGGGWTLVGRSDPGNDSAVYRQNGDTSPPGTSFGWKENSGSVTDDSAHYSINLSEYQIHFTQILFGSYGSGKTWGNYVYEETVSPTFLSNSSLTNNDYNIGVPTPIIGGNSGFSMAQLIGYTNNPDIYHWRDVPGGGYGLASNGWDTYYDSLNLPAQNGGYINYVQGMIMVR